MKLLTLLVALFLVPHAEAKKPGAPLVQKVSRARFEVSHRAVRTQIKNPEAQLGTFVALPASGSGFFSGIKVTGFTRNCLLPSFGIESGDVIEMVNGQTLTSIQDIMDAGEKLANAKPGHKVRVNLHRNGEDVVQTYLIVD